MARRRRVFRAGCAVWGREACGSLGERVEAGESVLPPGCSCPAPGESSLSAARGGGSAPITCHEVMRASVLCRLSELDSTSVYKGKAVDVSECVGFSLSIHIFPGF